MITLRDVQRLSPRERQKLLVASGLSTRDRRLIAALVAEADRIEVAADPKARKMVEAAKAWEAARPAPTYGDQGRPDMPQIITADGPHFHIYVRPCRPVGAGEVWETAGRTPVLFRGAALRYSRDDQIIEIIGTCEKPKVRWLDDGRRPWLRAKFGYFRVPTSRARWEGDPSTDCTAALRTALAPSWDDNLKRLTHDDACDHW